MSDAAALQFDRAEYGDRGATTECAFCHGQIPSSYFQINGQVACEACRYRLDTPELSGSRVGRFARALALGTGTAAGGAIVYYAIARLTGYEFGLIAIVVGFAVGAAVRKGSGGRGGWRYQTLAMALTYLAIVSTYIPPIVKAIRESGDKPAVSGPATPGQAGAQAQPVAASAPATAEHERVTVAQFALAIALLLALACAAPFFGGLQNIMGIVIIGIGLYEAWKLNRRIPLTITGPHVISRPSPAQA
jgi:hypothetical protein